MTWVPVLVREGDRGGRPCLRLGHEQVDRFLDFVSARARPNTTLATGYDLKVFFTVVAKEPGEVTTSDVLGFITEQRGDRGVVRLVDGESGLSARTIQRRLSSISGLFGFLLACGEVDANPVPRGLSNRKRSRTDRGTPLVRTPRTLPTILEPAEVDALLESCRRWRDRAMVEAMVFGALRRAEVLGLRLDDLKIAERRVFIANGKGGHQRLVPVSARFFDSVANYLRDERPKKAATDRVFVVLKGPNTGSPLSLKGLDQSSCPPVTGPGSSTAPVTNCATRVSPACERRACHWRQSRPKPVIVRSSRPGSTCTCRTTGSPTSTSEQPMRSTPTASLVMCSQSVQRWLDERRAGCDAGAVRGDSVGPRWRFVLRCWMRRCAATSPSRRSR